MRSRYRWYQFSLRSYVILMFVLAPIFTSVYKDRQRYRANSGAVASLASRRMTVQTVPGSSAWFWRLWRYGPTKVVDSVKSNGSPGVTDRDLQPLQELHDLRQVELSRTVITDVTLGYLRDNKRMIVLRIAGTRITNSGLENLRHFSRLEELDIGYNKNVTDDGLENLKKMANLRRLNLIGTRVTRTGVHALQTILPNCENSTNHTTWSREAIPNQATLQNKETILKTVYLRTLRRIT